MPEVSTVSQRTQIGLEAVGSEGVSVVATKILTASQITPGIQINTQEYRGSGFKFANIVVVGKEWIEASLAGPLTYSEVPYWLSGIMARQITGTVPTNVPPATIGKEWNFSINSSSPDVVQTYTVEQGSNVRAKKFSYGLMTAWGYSATRDAINMTGTMIGQLLTDPITMTPLTSAAEIPLVPVLPNGINLKIASTQAGLTAAMPLNRGFQLDFNLGSRFSPVWPLKRSLASFGAHVETPIDATCSITLEADSEGMALLTSMRANSKVFIELEAIGASLDTGAPGISETFKHTICGYISDPGSFDDADGVVAVTWGLTVAHDSVWGKATAIQVINSVTAL